MTKDQLMYHIEIWCRAMNFKDWEIRKNASRSLVELRVVIDPACPHSAQPFTISVPGSGMETATNTCGLTEKKE